MIIKELPRFAPGKVSKRVGFCAKKGIKEGNHPKKDKNTLYIYIGFCYSFIGYLYTVFVFGL